jgi:hypothetical protein
MNCFDKIITHGSVVLLALIFGVPIASAQDGQLYKKVGGWTINKYESSEVSNGGPSCSAVVFADHVNALRVERVAQGYVFGPNGLSRDAIGPGYPMDFWFDNDQSGRMGGQAAFVYDPAYPNDDWLSHVYVINEPTPFVKAITSRKSITFSFPSQNGGGDATSTFPLTNGVEVVNALDQCYLQLSLSKVIQKGDTSNVGSVPPTVGDRDCPDDGPRLPGSGLCQGRAVNYLTDTDPEAELYRPDCQWVVNETPMPGGEYLLYLAAKCGGVTSTLELSAGAHMATLSVVKSAMLDPSVLADGGMEVAKVFSTDGGSPEASIFQRASAGMDATEAAKCEVTKVDPEYGYPPDAYVVDYKPAFKAKLPTDEPPDWSCGDYGVHDSATFWRVFGGFAWYFDLGQDAWVDFQPGSLTLLTAADLGR